ncbi:hypothetical protein [Micromonospora profundi]|uniref:hypothetical protein n=1 Tax=Micromonospora profundi TaxID=1420889 RepID=UPI0038203403
MFVEAVAPEDAGEHCHIVVVELLGFCALGALLDVGGDEELWWQFTTAERARRSTDVSEASLELGLLSPVCGEATAVGIAWEVLDRLP